MALLASPVELTAIVDIPSAQAFVGLVDHAWEAVDAALGTVPNLRCLAATPLSAMQNAIMVARVQPPGTPALAVRALTAVELAQVGVVYRVARQKHGLPDMDPFQIQVPPAPLPGGGTTPVSGVRKVKFNMVIDQGEEAEIPTLDTKVIEEMHKVLVDIKGGAVRAEHEPSPDQMSALRTRVVDLKASPYADFALFTPYQLRFLKALKFSNHVLQPDGTFKTVEVPGPPNYDAWYASWKVFENTLLMLQIVDSAGALVPIITQSALDDYRESFRELVMNYPEAWRLCVMAEDRNRAENFDR